MPPFVPAKAGGGMHTSLNLYANAGLWLGRAVPHRSLPPCGGGTGRGVQQARHFFVIGDPTNAASLLGSLCKSTFALGASSPPPSLSLPRMGGGNRVARAFATLCC